MDNIDGKQARKTNSSSPLGMLFDHGCDSLSISIQSLSLAICIGFGSTLENYLVFAIASLPFATTTIEEYYNKEFVMGKINGPNEGCFIVGGFFILTGIFGNNFEKKYVMIYLKVHLFWIMMYLLELKKLTLSIFVLRSF